MMKDNRPQTVSELTRSIRGLLETHYAFVTVTGEVSNCKRPYSGHFYFVLKDSEAQIRVVLFKNQQRYLDTLPEDGKHIVCRGRLSVYEPRGEYQIIADFIDSQGSGLLALAFEKLKQRLADEGLFALDHKQELPLLPEKIFLVTSPSGAAMHDFLRVAAERFPAVPVRIVAVKVQGEGAAEEISGAIRLVNELDEEGVIVLCRGGGSLEDLWAFNEERVARAIFDSRLPVVSAVGHEVDVTIADFAADHRSATPTAAARDVLPDRTALSAQLRQTEKRMQFALRGRLDRVRHRLHLAREHLGDPTMALTHFRLRLDNSQLSLAAAMTKILHERRTLLSQLAAGLQRFDPRQRLASQRSALREQHEKLLLHLTFCMERKRQSLEKAAALLDAVSPLAVLSRGYAIVRRQTDDALVRSARQVAAGDTLRITLQQGELLSRVITRELREE